MSESKRKRHDEESQTTPRKKVVLDSPSHNIKVSVIQDDHPLTPVLLSTPGLALPKDIDFKPYSKARPEASRSSTAGPELLLHSSIHPKLDYTAREASSNGSDNYIKHYVGVYDPEKGTLDLMEARKAILRSTLRSARSAKSDDEDRQTKERAKDYLSARSDLGLAFGTKKSQKAIRALTANAIQSSPAKSTTQGSPAKSNQLDPLASAVVSSMAEATSSMRTREEMQTEIDEKKPRPKPNMQASSPVDAYPIEQLVGGANILPAMGVKDWIDNVNDGKDVQLKSRFVAKRLRATVQSGDVKKLKTMRYLLLLVEWCMALKPTGKSGKKVPKPEEMSSLVEAYGSDIVAGMAKRFADGFQLNKWHLDNLLTHILALAITVDNFTIDTHDIREDLRLEVSVVSKYYAELGCVVAAPTEAERSALGITKTEASNHRIARLRLPLVFPRMRVPMSKKRRR